MDMRFIAAWLGVALSLCSWSSSAEEALCAEVKIEILQELTMERQGFEALMRITNSLDTFSLENVSVKVLFTDVDGNPVIATSNTAASNAAFFIRIDDTRDVTGLQNGTDGLIQGGSIAPKKIGELRWLIIPTANAAGQTKDGKLFFVGAELKYSYGGKEEVVNVAADSIVVKPQPALTLDYFLTEEVVGDNGFTPEIEPAEPYTLGVRISNNGFGFAKSVKIESAQPRIVENKLGLAVNFKILSSYLKDQPAAPTLLINFGNIEPKGVTAGRWIMESNLAGKFTAFNASFTHADELGGELTSLLQATNANFLVRDVLMDLAGRDSLRDFLAYSATRVLYVYESEPTGLNEVTCTNCKKVAAVENAVIISEDSSRSRFDFEPVGGLTYAQAADPFNGNKVLAKVVRENGSVVHPQNTWLSKKRAADNISFEYFVNIFDNNSNGSYTLYWGGNLVDLPQPPVLQFMQDVVTFEGGNIGFLVRATDPNNTLPTITPLRLPAGASFNPSAVNQGVFNWTPAIGQAGNYVVTFIATDGELTAERSVNIIVHPANDTDGDGMDDDWEREKFGNLDKDGTEDTDGDGRTDLQEFEDGTDPNLIEAMPAAPQILSPIFDADTLDGELFPLQPELVVSNGEHPANVDAVAIVFEVYKDEALTELMGTATLNEGEGAETPDDGTTHWKISPVDLIEGFAFEDNTLYYWRAKSIQTINGNASSEWIKSRFFINTVNDFPSAPQVSSPAIEATIAVLSPTLVVTNSTDLDRDELRYAFELYAEADLERPVATVSGLFPGINGETSWPVAKVLEEDQRYMWQASVSDEHNAVVKSEWGSFIVSTQNAAPSAPEIIYPLVGDTSVSLSANNTLLLTVKNATDPERKNLNYLFELDTQNTFDSPNKQVSAAVPEGAENTSWGVVNLLENQLYYWRARANDGAIDGAWVMGVFTLSGQNEPPSIPTILNPDNNTTVNSLRPVFEVNPAVDPEGGSVSYHFEIYSTPEAQTLVGEKLTSSTQWVFESDLADKQTYYWRVQAEDEKGLVSAWSSMAAFTIVVPVLNVAPALSFVLPDQLTVDVQKRVLLQWVDADPDSSAKISLYHKNLATNEVTKFAEGIEEDLDGEGDQYLWFTDTVPAGDYKVSAVISDAINSIQSDMCCTVRVQEPVLSGLRGRFYGYHQPSNGNVNLTNLAQVLGIIANTTPSAVFLATNFQYSGVAGADSLGAGNNLQTFLKGDAASLSADPASTTDAILHFNGKIQLNAGNYNFRVSADDGYSIRINGTVVAEFNANTSALTRTHAAFTVTQSGLQDIEIVYWDSGVGYALNVELRNRAGGVYKYLDSSILLTGIPSIDTKSPFTPSAKFDATNKVIAGIAEAGSNVVVKNINGDVLGEIQANATHGQYTIPITYTLVIGESLFINATDAAGNVSAATTIQVTAAPQFVLGGLRGSYYGYQQSLNGNVDLSNVAQVLGFIGNEAPDATFVATNFQYGVGSGANDLGMGNNLQIFLKGDAASLSADPASTTDAIVRFDGKIQLNAGSYNFRVNADDGYSIRINGTVVAEYNANTAAVTRTHAAFTVTESGLQDIEIVYWDAANIHVLNVELASSATGVYSYLNGSILLRVAE
jgi:hypothetical protein